MIWCWWIDMFKETFEGNRSRKKSRIIHRNLKAVAQHKNTDLAFIHVLSLRPLASFLNKQTPLWSANVYWHEWAKHENNPQHNLKETGETTWQLADNLCYMSFHCFHGNIPRGKKSWNEGTKKSERQWGEGGGIAQIQSLYDFSRGKQMPWWMEKQLKLTRICAYTYICAHTYNAYNTYNKCGLELSF